MKNVWSEKNESSKQMADEEWETLNIEENENPTDVIEPAPLPVPLPVQNAAVVPPQMVSPPPPGQPSRRRIIVPPPPPPLPAGSRPIISPPPPPIQLNRSRRATGDLGAGPRRTRRSIKYTKEGQFPVATDVEEWLQFRIEQPLRYTVASDGSYLASPVDVGGKATSRNKIQPAPFYRASKEQINAAYLNDRMDTTVLEADNLYKEARETLMQHYREYQASVADPRMNPQQKLALRHEIIQDNISLGRVEKARNRAYRRNCRVETYSGTMRPLLFQMLPDEAVDKEKVFLDDVQMCRRGNFPWAHFYTDSLPEVVVPQVQVPVQPQGEQQQGGAEREYSSEQLEIIKRKKIAQWRNSRRAARF